MATRKKPVFGDTVQPFTKRDPSKSSAPPQGSSPLDDYRAASPKAPTTADGLAKAVILAHCSCADCEARRASEAER